MILPIMRLLILPTTRKIVCDVSLILVAEMILYLLSITGIDNYTLKFSKPAMR